MTEDLQTRRRFRALVLLGLALVCVKVGVFTACQRDIPTGALGGGAIELAGKPSGGDPTVTATDPSEAPRDTTLDVRVLGSGYDPGSRAEFTLDGQATPKVRTNSTRYVNSRELVANITITADAVPEFYDVEVTTTQGKRGIGIEMFAIFIEAIELGSLGGGSGQAIAINESGQVAGYSKVTRRGEYELFFWTREGGMERVGPGNIEDLGENGWIVGSNNLLQAGFWEKNGAIWSFHALPLPTGYTGWSNARGINPAGDVIVGNALLWTRDGSSWSVSFIPLPPGRTSCEALRVNGAGFIIGTCDGQGAAWKNDSGTWTFPPLDPLPGDLYSTPFRLNAAGDAVGWSNSSSSSSARAVLWRRNAVGWDPPYYLGSFGGFSQAGGINTYGSIVGGSQRTNGQTTAVLWTPGGGMLDLGIPSKSQSYARDINDSDQIVGDRGLRPVLWEPASE